MLLSIGSQHWSQLLKAELEVQAALPPEVEAQINAHAASWLGAGLLDDLQYSNQISLSSCNS